MTDSKSKKGPMFFTGVSCGICGKHLVPFNFNSLPDIVEILLSATITIPSEHFAPITTVNIYTTI